MHPIPAALFAALASLSVVTVAVAQSDLVATGCPSGQSFAAGPITVTGAYARATPKGAPSAGAYFTVANTGAAPDTLLGANSGAASDLALHEMKMNGNVMEMDPLAGGLAISRRRIGLARSDERPSDAHRSQRAAGRRPVPQDGAALRHRGRPAGRAQHRRSWPERAGDVIGSGWTGAFCPARDGHERHVVDVHVALLLPGTTK